MMQDCEPFRDELEAYTLDAVDAGTRRRVEAHLRDCASCREIVRSYNTTIGQMAFAAPLIKAPPRLKERVLGSVGAFRPTVSPVTLVRASRWWAAAAAVFLAFGIGAVIWAVILSNRVDRLRQDNANLAQISQLDEQQRSALLQLESDLNSAKNKQKQMESTLADQATLLILALDPDLIPTDLQGTSVAPDATCRYVWSTKQSLGGLTCSKMPAISFTLTYQLWAVRGDKVTAMGTFSPRPDGSAQLLYKPNPDNGGGGGPITNMFVTLEVSSQSPKQPSAEVVLNRAPDQQAAR
ncbi:MAG TPA: anti-sigma factor [Dehalococcoidia bacterium]